MNKEEKNRKYLIGWDHIVNLVWGKKAQGWLGVWGLADWIYCVSGQMEYLQGHENGLSLGLLTRHPGQEQLHLGSRNLFQLYS